MRAGWIGGNEREEFATRSEDVPTQSLGPKSFLSPIESIIGLLIFELVIGA